MTQAHESKWAPGYAAGKASLQAELEWHRAEVERLRSLSYSAIPEGWQLVPKEPPEAMWGGLARDIIMWTRMYGSKPGEPTGRQLHQHLRSKGAPIPNWLAQEINDADRVPSKGTVAVCIYKAMLEGAPLVAEKQTGAK